MPGAEVSVFFCRLVCFCAAVDAWFLVEGSGGKWGVKPRNTRNTRKRATGRKGRYGLDDGTNRDSG